MVSCSFHARKLKKHFQTPLQLALWIWQSLSDGLSWHVEGSREVEFGILLLPLVLQQVVSWRPISATNTAWPHWSPGLTGHLDFWHQQLYDSVFSCWPLAIKAILQGSSFNLLSNSINCLLTCNESIYSYTKNFYSLPRSRTPHHCLPFKEGLGWSLSGPVKSNLHFFSGINSLGQFFGFFPLFSCLK